MRLTVSLRVKQTGRHKVLLRAWPYVVAGIAPFILWFPVVIGRQFFGHADPGVQFIPLFQFYGAYLQSYGTVPLWNNYIFSGFPTYASVVGGFFYPVHWLYALLPARELYAWLLYIQFALTGIASVRLGRLLSFTRGGSLVAALAYIFCSQAIEWGINNVYYTILWVLPVVYICLIQLSRQLWPDAAGTHFSRLGFMRVAALLSFTLAAGWLASAPQLLLYTMTIAAISALYLDIKGRALSSARAPWYALKVVYTLIVCTVFATAIGLIQILPSLRLLPLTERAGGLDYVFASRGAVSIINFYRYLWPEYAIESLADWSGVFLFIGILPLLFALYAFADWRKNWQVPFFGSVFLFSLAAAIRWSPLQYVIFHAPLYNLFRGPSRWMLWGSFGLAFLAGIGWDRVKLHGLKRSWFATSALTLLGVIAAVRFGHVLLTWYHLKTVEPIKAVLEKYLYILFHIKPLVLFYRASDIFSAEFIPATLFIGISILTLYLVYVRVLSLRTLELVVLGVILSNVLTAHPTYRQMVSPNLYSYVPQTVVSIREHSRQDTSPFRVFVYRRDLIAEKLETQLTSDQKWILRVETLTPNTNMYYGLESVEGYDNFAPTRYMALLSRIQTVPTSIASENKSAEQILSEHINLLSFMNVRYIVSPIPLTHPALRQIKTIIVSTVDLKLFLYSNAEAADRIRWAHAPEAGRIVLSEIRPGRYDITVATEQEQPLVLAESFLPGWRAFIDGARVDIEPYAVYQSITVPPGSHLVRWEYQGI